MIILNITDIDATADSIIRARDIDDSWTWLGMRQAVADHFDDPEQQPDTATRGRIANRILLTIFPDDE